MGGCYSSDSESAAASPRHKLPCRQPRSNGKGPHYSPLTNGDAQHQEHRNLHQDDQIPEQTIAPLSTDNVVPTLDSQLSPADVGKGVAPSDSGIESIGPPVEESDHEPVEQKEVSLCKSCHNKLKRISRGSCQQCGHFRLDTSELSLLVNGDTYCTCGPRQVGKQSSCLTHGSRGKNTKMSPSPHRHSDIPARLLKSNLKKQGQERGDSKHVRMSWKSSDSLDMNSSMYTCMDRAKSEASDVFGDDVSFRAPLAQFDSVDNQLNEETVDDEENDVFLASRMSIYSEILDLADSICHCEFSDGPLGDLHACSNSTESHTPNLGKCERVPSPKKQLPSLGKPSPARLIVNSGQLCSGNREEEDEDSGHGLSKSEGLSGSDYDVEGADEMEEHSVASCSLSLGHAAASALENLSLECEEVFCPVSVIVKGRQMVVMDARTYSQMLNDLTLLKKQLYHLSQIIQEEEEEDIHSFTFCQE